MAITTQGYDGVEHEIDEVGWADISGAYGSNYSVRGYSGAPDEGAGKVSVVSSADRTVAVAPGVFYGHGVRDISDSTVNVQCPAVASGTSRWFTIAVRRDWQANTTTIAVIPEGQDGRVLAPQRNTTPGVADDQPLALVQIVAGQSIPTAVVDLRCWSGNAGLVAATTDALAYLDRLGSRVTIDGMQWSRVLDGNGQAVWSPSTNQIIYSGNFVYQLNGAGGGSLQFPNGGFPNACTGISIQSRDGSSEQLFNIAIIPDQFNRFFAGFVVRNYAGQVVTGHRRFTYIAVGY